MNVCRAEIIKFVAQAGNRYWKNGKFPKDKWQNHSLKFEYAGNHWIKVALPKEYTDLGVDGELLVDRVCLINQSDPSFDNCDWYLAAYLYLVGVAERKHEKLNGPIHSFSFRLNIPAEYFDYAWANRILLLLRRMHALEKNVDEVNLFGPLPIGEIRLEHDVDAIDKTWPVRIKQTIFECFNFAKYFLTGQIKPASEAFKRGIRVFFLSPKYDQLNWMADQEKARGLAATYYIHARKKWRTPKSWLLDPGYFCDDIRIKSFVCERIKQGFSFGLHPSYDSFESLNILITEQDRLSNALEIEVKLVRQHWLRFSWKNTWRIQESAGLTSDATMGFNDRPGFRCGAALEYIPWDCENITSVPVIMMDSHFYSYNLMSDDQRRKLMSQLIKEVINVGGVACVNWHPHTTSEDYSWGEGYIELLDILS